MDVKEYLEEKIIVLENSNRKLVKCIFENGGMIYKGEEFYDTFKGDDEGFEWIVTLDEENTEKLFQKMWDEFDRKMPLNDIFVDMLSMGNSYDKLLKYCDGNGIIYRFWSI